MKKFRTVDTVQKEKWLNLWINQSNVDPLFSYLKVLRVKRSRQQRVGGNFPKSKRDRPASARNTYWTPRTHEGSTGEAIVLPVARVIMNPNGEVESGLMNHGSSPHNRTAIRNIGRSS